MRSRTLFQGEELLGAERFVVDLRGGLDQVLEVGACEEVAQVDEFAVTLVFDVDGAPAVLAAANGFAADVEAVFATDYGEGDDGLVGSVSGKRVGLKSRSGLVHTLICWFIAASSLSYSSFS